MKSLNLHRYFILSIKRTLKKPFILVLLCLLPLITFLFTHANTTEKELYVGVYTDAPSGFSYMLTEKLANRDGIYHFYIVSSAKQLYQDVASGYAECGYIFPAQLLDNLNQGKKKNLVDLITSSSTTMSKITNEIVYSELFEEYSLCILETYLSNDSPLENVTTAEIEALYREYLSNGSTFAFDIIEAYKDYSTLSTNITQHAVTGIIGILILLGGFSGLFQYATDHQNMLYANLPFAQTKMIAFIQILCPLVLFSLTGGLCLFQIGYFTGIGSLIQYLLYILLTLILCLLLYPLLRFRMMLVCLLPLYLLGCLIFTPIFIDISVYLPNLRWIGYLFITNYLL